ncbi:MAG: hypothetical protein AAF394_18995, partial [Planctomycetota bacterium]
RRIAQHRAQRDEHWTTVEELISTSFLTPLLTKKGRLVSEKLGVGDARVVPKGPVSITLVSSH